MAYINGNEILFSANVTEVSDIKIDDTLSIAGAAADAKATGDALKTKVPDLDVFDRVYVKDSTGKNSGRPYTQNPNPSSLVWRNSNGLFQIKDAVQDNQPVSKGQMDAAIASAIAGGGGKLYCLDIYDDGYDYGYKLFDLCELYVNGKYIAENDWTYDGSRYFVAVNAGDLLTVVFTSPGGVDLTVYSDDGQTDYSCNDEEPQGEDEVWELSDNNTLSYWMR